jgi:hypothetical protein
MGTRKKQETRAPEDPIVAAAGLLKGRIPPVDVIRAQARHDERNAIARRERDAENAA